MTEIKKLQFEIEALTALKETYWNMYVAAKLKNEELEAELQKYEK